MYKHCTTEESVLRQRQIEQCLLDLMQNIPYPQISIVEICQHTGLSRKSFYRYFGSKEDCLTALIDHAIIDGASQYFPEEFEHQSSRRIYERFFGYWKQMAPLLEILDRNALIHRLTEQMLEYLDKEERSFHMYLGGAKNNSHEQMLFITSGVMGLLMYWHRSGYRQSVSKMADILEKVVQK